MIIFKKYDFQNPTHLCIDAARQGSHKFKATLFLEFWYLD